MPQAQPTIACLCAFGVALINNSGFCVVVAASQHLADKVFFAPNLLTLFTFSANLASFAATFFNARFLVKFSFISRIRGACIALLVGYGMLAVAVLLHGEPPICMDPTPAPRYFSRLKPRERCEWMGHVWMERPNYLGFTLALLGSVVIGACQAVGEVTNVALYKAFPPSVLACWGAGTGVAGLLGPALFLVMTSYDWLDFAKFVVLAPTALLMDILFRRLHRSIGHVSPPSHPRNEASKVRGHDSSSDDDRIALMNGMLEDGQDVDQAEVTHLTANSHADARIENVLGKYTKLEPSPNLNMATAAKIARSPFLARLILHCAAVYFLEYSIYPGLVDRDTQAEEGASLLNRNAFILCWMAYNVGVTVSRSSVSCWPIRRVWIVTSLQLLNCLAFAVEAKVHFLPHLGDTGYVVMICWMVWVGLMGGAAYSNCTHLVNTHPAIPDELRELGTNATFLLINMAIMGSALLSLVLNAWLYRL